MQGCNFGLPPFAGHKELAEAHQEIYTEFLRGTCDEAGGKCDLVAFFFRRAFDVLRKDGRLGLLATKTIGQGDTRQSGLRWICTHGGVIYSARKRYKWPGQAAVVVSVIHIAKGNVSEPFDLDGREAPIITAYLFHAGGHDNPSALEANRKQSFQGTVIRGMGFTFDDTDAKKVASPIEEMHRLIRSDPRNSERIFPYIGGEEVNDSPLHRHHRYVINFGEMSEEEARRWPELFELVRAKVLPERQASTAKSSSGKITEKFWQFGHTAKSLYESITGLERALVCLRVSQTLAFTFLRTDAIFANTLNVFAKSSFSTFATLQSRCHEFWARSLSSTFKDDQAYHPSDCFETFPFPAEFETDAALEAAGREYYEFRAALMVRQNEGLTKTYNRFHDPEESAPDIHQLRQLHAQMDATVLTAYGWTDLLPKCTCEFLLDYEDEESESTAEESTGRKKKKPWRYRWPDEVRDEVLARLLKLNAERAAGEKSAANSIAAATPSKPKKVKAKKSDASPGQGDLIAPPQKDLFG